MLRRLLLSLLCLVSLLPGGASLPGGTAAAYAQTNPASPLVFTPVPAPPRLVFTPLPTPVPLPTSAQIQNLTAQLAASQAQLAASQAQAKAAQAQAALTAPTVYGQPYADRFSGGTAALGYADASPSGPHLVFPHLQTSGGDYGKSYNPAPFNDGSTSPSVAQSTLDINEAASCAADGFSMDLQGDTNAYASTVENMLSAGDAWTPTPAAAALGITGFHSFLTFDFSTFPENPATIARYIARAVQHPSYYRYKGLPFVSTYAGEGGGYAVVKSVWQQVFALLKAQNITVYFVPGFNLTDAAGNSLSLTPANFAAQATGLLTQIPAQGEWQYGNGLGIPLGAGSPIPGADAQAAAAKAAGLTFMASVSPQYEGLDKAGHWYSEFAGGEALDHEWSDIILSQQPAWAEEVTWNDFGEYSRETNADEGPASPWPYLAHSSQAGYYLSTLGQQALSRYYVQWYKTGVRPTFASDNLWAFYRTQPAALDVPGDEADKPGYFATENGAATSIPDTFYIATGLPSQATLTVTNGGQTFTSQVPAGLFFSRVGPFVPGPVTMTLSRAGAVTTTLTGAPIASSAAWYDWSQWSGWAHN